MRKVVDQHHQLSVDAGFCWSLARSRNYTPTGWARPGSSRRPIEWSPRSPGTRADSSGFADLRHRWSVGATVKCRVRPAARCRPTAAMPYASYRRVWWMAPAQPDDCCCSAPSRFRGAVGIPPTGVPHVQGDFHRPSSDHIVAMPFGSALVAIASPRVFVADGRYACH